MEEVNPCLPAPLKDGYHVTTECCSQSDLDDGQNIMQCHINETDLNLTLHDLLSIIVLPIEGEAVCETRLLKTLMC